MMGIGMPGWLLNHPDPRTARRSTALLSRLVAALLLAMAWKASAAPSPPQQMEQAIAYDYDVQDARLNTAYRKLASSLDAARRKALRDEERAWMVERDQACGKGSAPGSVARNACTLARTSARADKLEKQVSKLLTEGFSGSYGYQTHCNFGHYVQFVIKHGAPDYAGTWSDGTRVHGDFGEFRGQERNGQLYVRFCTAGGMKGWPECPAYGAEDDAYFVSQGR
uniref:lysozyme inhibitor LprI family protein n=1 Tax=Frateuria defendens TaxID=2219559 RepID=UPI0012938A42